MKLMAQKRLMKDVDYIFSHILSRQRPSGLAISEMHNKLKEVVTREIRKDKEMETTAR